LAGDIAALASHSKFIGNAMSFHDFSCFQHALTAAMPQNAKFQFFPRMYWPPRSSWKFRHPTIPHAANASDNY
jgi:hypothetical protein